MAPRVMKSWEAKKWVERPVMARLQSAENTRQGVSLGSTIKT